MLHGQDYVAIVRSKVVHVMWRELYWRGKNDFIPLSM